MPENPEYSPKLGRHDAVINGELVLNIPSRFVYVTDENDLDLLEDEPVGTIAMAYESTDMWRKKDDGTWVSF